MSATRAVGERIQWYRSPVPREDLSRLNKRSDVKGLLQTVGFLGWLALTGSAAYFSAGRLPWPLVVVLFYIHGMGWHFLVNAFHELVHDSVFKTRWLNWLFLRVVSFLGWYNPYHFWASHTEHHKFTLHPPDDLEVVLPAGAVRSNIVFALGRVEGQWTHQLFDQADAKLRRKLANWARLVLLGHVTIATVSVYMHWWLLPVVVTLAPFYGGALHYLCNNSQHAGMRDNVPDFRLCCRTIYLNPFVQFLYWHMNYHTEHHMYAAVPCYNLGKLHRIIKDDLPACPRGLVQTWRQIGAIMEKQQQDPSYNFTPQFPATARTSPALAAITASSSAA